MDDEENKTPEELPEEQVEDTSVGEEVPEETGTDAGATAEADAQSETHGLKDGFGRDEYAKTIGNKNYYKDEAAELKKRQQDARMEQANRYKKKSNGEESSDSDSKTSSSTSEESSNKDSKNLSKEERDAQNKSATTDDKEKKNIIDKAKDARNTHQANKAVMQNKINNLKSKAYGATHPIEAAKAKAKNKAKKKMLSLMIKYWYVFAIAFAVIFLILLILIFAAALSDGDGGGTDGYLDPTYDYTSVVVTLTNSYTNEEDKVELEDKISIKELVLGSVYYETRNKTDGLTDEELKELYKTYCVLLKTEALKLGGYTNETMEISIKSGGDLPYCDPYNGCVVKEQNGIKTFVSKYNEEDVEGTIISEIDPMDDHQLSILESAYSATKYEILTPDSVKVAITNYNYANPEYTSAKKQSMNKQADESKTYDEILDTTYPGYDLYDIRDYATFFSYTENTAYWWPIGSASASSGSIYGGNPSSTTVTSEFSPYRCIQGTCKAHKGIDIGGSQGSTVIVATRSGTVTTAMGGCSSMGSYGSTCNGGYGNYVIIDHGDGTSSVYAHMYKDSIVVEVGDTVEQGEKIGLMGSSGSSTGTHLHFEIRVNGTAVNPLDYVDPDNPRPVSSTGDGTVVEGNSNVQTVCLTLKASGFTNEAVAGIMANIERESNFSPSAVGDSGTSFGICQWHNGRGSNMKSYCGSNWSSDVGCQVKYLIYELKNSETGAYNALLAGGSAYDLGAAFCTKFERPADTGACYSVRGVSARDKYYPYVKNNCSN